MLVRKSNIHGMGVFATKAYNKRDKLCVYPKHFMLTNNCKSISGLIPRPENITDEELQDYALKYCITTINDGINYGAIPSVYDDENCGHLINDAKPLNFNDVASVHSMVKKCKLYENSRDLCNCEFIVKNNEIHIVATKDINEGDELLVHYGIPYWFNLLKFSRRKCDLLNALLKEDLYYSK